MKLRKILSLALSLMLLVSVSIAHAQDLGADDSFSNFPFGVTNNEPSIEGGTLKFGIMNDGPFNGLLSYIMYEDNNDVQIIQWTEEQMLSADEDFVFDQDGPCTYTYDKDAKTVTLNLTPGIKWHDGEPVTLDDLVFAYEVICHADYEGMRYDEQMENVVGAVEYHAGTAEKISGLALSDDKMSLTISFIDFKPTILVGGFWIAAAPRHYLGDVPVKDLLTSEKIRTNPIGFGPFKVQTVVPGEAVELVRYDDYWRGTPKLDGVTIRVINPDLIPQVMESGDVDICEFNTQVYPDYENPTNFQYIGQLATVFNYTGFDLGDYDKEKEINVADPNKKMTNLSLRQAMGYAVNNAQLGEEMYNGLRVLATTAITPRHGGYQNKEIAGYYYDPDKAKSLLDEAGYIDIDGDGYREDPNGEQLTIYWAFMSGAGAETISQFKIQNWKDVGLRVELYNDRLMDFNVFYDAIQYDEEGIDMFDGAWQTGFDPDPSQLWGANTVNNFPHATTPELIAAMTDCASEQSWDDDFRTAAYKKWQEVFFEQAMAIPTLWRTELYAANNRVKNYDMSSVDIDYKLHLVELTAENSYKK